jgi:Ubiquitin carboxyl-terminal hydrolases
LAITGDPRIALRANPSVENDRMLAVEERKRAQWARENVLRRHNFVNLVYLVTKAAVQESIERSGNIDELIENGKASARRKSEFVEGMKKSKGDPMDTL